MTNFTVAGEFTPESPALAASYSATDEELLQWSPWQPLMGCWRGRLIPALPGLYRIRRAGHEDLDYIGQTGSGRMTLRKRLAMLCGVYAGDMPYRDPHTAAPALWALRHRDGCDFEVSVAPVAGTTQWRKGLEALAISLYREERKSSPCVNFGRMPAGYGMSSGNNTSLASSGKRFRGGLTRVAGACHVPGIKPAGPLIGDVQGPGWCGHCWSGWLQVSEAVRMLPLAAAGLYRLRGRGLPGLLYVGQGKFRGRLAAHLAKARFTAGAQGEIFAGVSSLECSWVVGDAWLPHQRLELENDLIAAHVLSTGTAPAAQFLG